MTKAEVKLTGLARVDPARLAEAVPFRTVKTEWGSCDGTVRYGVGVYTLELTLDEGQFYLMRSETKPEAVYGLVVEIIRQYAAGTLYEIARNARIGRERLDPRVAGEWVDAAGPKIK